MANYGFLNFALIGFLAGEGGDTSEVRGMPTDTRWRAQWIKVAGGGARYTLCVYGMVVGIAGELECCTISLGPEFFYLWYLEILLDYFLLLSL